MVSVPYKRRDADKPAIVFGKPDLTNFCVGRGVGTGIEQYELQFSLQQDVTILVVLV